MSKTFVWIKCILFLLTICFTKLQFSSSCTAAPFDVFLLSYSNDCGSLVYRTLVNFKYVIAQSRLYICPPKPSNRQWTNLFVINIVSLEKNNNVLLIHFLHSSGEKPFLGSHSTPTEQFSWMTFTDVNTVIISRLFLDHAILLIRSICICAE